MMQIDFVSMRLYWTGPSWDISGICSRSLEGGETVTSGSSTNPDRPYGIAVLGERIYWGTFEGSSLNSMLKSGTDFRFEGDVENGTFQFAGPNWNPPRNRINHCEQQHCEGVCVLSRRSFKCLK